MRVGPWEIGVRVDDPTIESRLIAALPGLLRETAAPPSGYDIVTTAPAGQLPQLRRGPCPVLGSRSVDRLIRALALHLESHASVRPDHVRLRCAAVSSDRAAVLLGPEQLWQPGLERRLERYGLQPLDAPAVEIDAERRVAIRGQGRTEGTCHAEILRWLIPPTPGLAYTTTQPSGRTALAALLIDEGNQSAQAALETVAALEDRIDVQDEPRPSPTTLAATLVELLRV